MPTLDEINKENIKTEKDLWDELEKKEQNYIDVFGPITDLMHYCDWLDTHDSNGFFNAKS
jgi:hypothetical protein